MSGAKKPIEKAAIPTPASEELLRRLSQTLETLDFLLLDSRDMTALRKAPEVAAVIEHFVRNGGTVFAFISEAGDFSRVFGAPFAVAKLGKPSDRFELSPGVISGVVPKLEKKIKVKSKRALPDLDLATSSGWRVVAYTKGQKGPRIVERGERDKGGLVVVWLDDPTSFQGRKGGTEPAVEKIRADLEARVIAWARFLMYRRYDSVGQLRQRAEEALRR